MDVDRIVARRTQKGPLGKIYIVTGDGRIQGLQRNTPGLEGKGIGMDPDRIVLLAKNLHLRHASNPREGWHDPIDRVFIELVDRHVGCREGNKLNRCSRRIQLLDKGETRHARRQQMLRLGHRVFHILGGNVNILAQVEL